MTPQKSLIPGSLCEAWFDLFTDPHNEDTFLDHIESVIQAGYDFDSRAELSKIARRNCERLKILIAEKIDGPDISKTADRRVFLQLCPEEYDYIAKRAKLYEAKIPHIIRVLIRRGIQWEEKLAND